LPFLAKTDYEGVTAKIAFEQDGELKNPSVTIFVYKDRKKVPVN